MSDIRPNPEKLLQKVQEEEQKARRGKLKIYLGAAPGVGKTHEMLHDALEEKDKHLDVVIGIIESHGRKEIEKIANYFEILPREIIQYHGKELLEFDLNAALKRQPALIIMDEMAHTNAEGVRHKKRWQDIKELLDRGIDVYTTLNVQHIESLNDDVSQITHTSIKETVPDSMIEMADTLELVDLPPEELLKRLEEGKVYVQQQADLAIEHFFKKGNLIALRELALRTMAEHVGAQVLLYRQGQGIKHIWPTKEKILVCVGPGLESRKLIRAARRMAMSLHIDWIAVLVDTPQIQSSEFKKNKAIQNLHFAEQMGADTRVLTGFDVVKEIMSYAREQNVTQIMIWKNIRSRFSNFFFRDIADEIVRYSDEIDVYIMTGNNNLIEKSDDKTLKSVSISWKNYFISLSVVALTTVLNFLLYPFLSSNNLIMVYLLGVTIVSLMGKIGPSILVSVLSVLAYDFFFIAPFYSFGISDIQYFFTLIVMLLVSLIISNLILRLRRQAESARFAEHQTASLHALSKQLASTRGIDKLLEVGSHYIADMFNCEVIALIPKGDKLVIQSKNTIPELNKKEQGIAQWVYELGRMAGVGTDTLSFSNALYLPLLASQGPIGVLRILPKTKHLLLPEQIHLLESFTNQIALALEVDKLQEQKKKKKLKSKTHQAQDALLQAVSHDLRAPLVAVLGDASTLIEMANELDPKQIKKIGKDIYVELEQHTRLINNLLQINYLETGSIKLQKKFTSLNELIILVVKTSSKKLGKRKVNIDVSADIPLIPIDDILIQEVLLNLIDNAVKFTTPDTPIDIVAALEKNKVVISIGDKGPGIVPDEVNKLFEKYYRGRKLTSERGLGLGLAICHAIIKAHGGKIWAENRKDGGAFFHFTLPLNDN